MRTGKLVLARLMAESRSFWRNPGPVFMTFFFRLILLLVAPSIIPTAPVPAPGGGFVEFEVYFVPAILAFGLMSSGYFDLADMLVARRDEGVLKRARTTPVSTSIFFTGMVLNAISKSIVSLVVILSVGWALYDVGAPTSWITLAVATTIGAASFAALGIGVSGLIPTGDASQAVLFATFYPVAIMSGIVFPVEEGSVVDRVSSFLPTAHFIDAVTYAFTRSAGSALFPGRSLLVVGVWGVLGLILGATTFRWLPRDR